MHGAGHLRSSVRAETRPLQDNEASRTPGIDRASHDVEWSLPFSTLSVNDVKKTSCILFIIIGALQFWMMIGEQTARDAEHDVFFWSYFYWATMLVGLHVATTIVLLFRICPAPEEWGLCVAFVKGFIVLVHIAFGTIYADEPGHPSFWLLGFAMWAWSDALATIVLIDFSEAGPVQQVSSQ